MKHLLFISILIFSSFLTSCEKKEETLYKWETSSGIVWKRFGDKDTHPVYKGEVENGVPNGLGILISPMGGKYVGEWKNGEKNGLGTRTYPVGWEVGEYKDGVLWNGTYYDENGNIFSKFVNGERIKQ